jgi:hypothetical protein
MLMFPSISLKYAHNGRLYVFSETALVHFLKIYACDRRLWWYDRKADIEVTVGVAAHRKEESRWAQREAWV